MHEFAVWAPRRAAVELFLGGNRHAMAPNQDGWWRLDVDEAGPGTRYGFYLDGIGPYPDPRSAYQPEGVDGLSEVVDQEGFDWSDGNWNGLPLPGAVLYECHIGTFSQEGTFDGAVGPIPHLVDLGVDALEMLPIAEFSGERGWGYDGVDLFAPHHSYGGPAGLKRLVDACHGAGLGVVLDVVYNHLGPAGNYLGEFGPYFTDRYKTNWGEAVNLDGPGSHEVRRFFIDNAVTWLRDYHFDGLRLDAVHAIFDRSALHFLEELSDEVHALSAETGRNLFLIAESDLNDPRFVRSRDAGGYGLDASWADEWHHALHAALTGETSGYYEDFGSLDLLAKALRQAWVYDGTFSAHRQRAHGRQPIGLTGDRFVVFTQNHDQVGNRALGERLGQLTSPARLKIAAALLLTGPFTPLLFQGEEWGASAPFLYFTDHRTEDLARAVTEGRRQEFSSFGWDPSRLPDPQQLATYERSKLDWDEHSDGLHAELHAWHRRLISLRKSVSDLSDPRLDTLRVSCDSKRGVLVVQRRAVAVAVNLGERDARLECSGVLLAGSAPGVLLSEGTLRLPPDSVAILEGDVAEFSRD